MTEEENRRRAEALLEQLRRLERSVSALQSGLSPHMGAPEEETANVNPEKFVGYTEKMVVNYNDNIAYNREETAGAQGIQKNVQDQQSILEAPARETGPADRGQTLLEQLGRLERAAEPQMPFRGAQRGQDSPQNRIVNQNIRMDDNPRGSSGWGVPAGFRREDTPPGGELRQAERTDRIFRRDSRRYDGGFTLY